MSYLEPRVVPLPADVQAQQAILDSLAAEGWRLVAVDARIAYLVREQTGAEIHSLPAA